MDALTFIVDSVLTLAVYAFLLRLLLTIVRADFRNPLSQAILALTNWLVLPLRRILPPVGRGAPALRGAAIRLRAAVIHRPRHLQPGGKPSRVALRTVAPAPAARAAGCRQPPFP